MIRNIRALALAFCLIPVFAASPLAAVYELTVQTAGSGSGTVTSVPAGINCGNGGSDCQEQYSDAAYVTLTATAAPGSVFVGWGGACPSYSGYSSHPECAFWVSENETVVAYFNPPAPDQALVNQEEIEATMNGPVSEGTWHFYSVDVESGAAELVVDLHNLEADGADLYVRFGTKPNRWEGGQCVWLYLFSYPPKMRCAFLNPTPGRWWVGILNRAEGVDFDYKLVANWGIPPYQELANHSPYSGSVSAGGWRYSFVDLEAGSTDLAVELSNLAADADLYLRHGSRPDLSTYDCSSAQGSTQAERCDVADPAEGRWWIGVFNGSPAPVGHALKASWQTPAAALDFYTIAPCRVIDTRENLPWALPLDSGTPRTLWLASWCGLQTWYKAVALNVTVLGSAGPGSLVLYPRDGGIPSTSTLDFGAGQTRSNSVILKVEDGYGHLGALATIAGGGKIHLIVDVVGYFD